MKLRQIAYARSGDKGDNANIGLIAYDAQGYEWICQHVTAERVQAYFALLGVKQTLRYELRNLQALNFILLGVLDGGGSLSLRIDNQGKVLGQALLEMEIKE